MPRKKSTKSPVVSNSNEPSVVSNGLQEALFPGGAFGPGAQISQATTVFGNLRWYFVSNMRSMLTEMFVEYGLVQTIVNVPVDDAFRGGVEVTTKQLSQEQLKKLQAVIEREDILGTVCQATKWNRLYGGAGVIIMTDQDPATPLNVAAIRPDSPLEFIDADMWELFGDINSEVTPSILPQRVKEEFFNYYGVRVHKSRVKLIKGLKAPSFVRPRLRGWGFSVVEALVQSINQYLKSNALSFEVLDEFKVDVFGIKGLSQTLLSSGGTDKIQKRVQLANREKNYLKSLVMDSEDTYSQKQLSFSGLAEVMKEIRLQIASDMRMPLTKIFGISAQGFNSGEDDIENYNAMVESEVRTKTKFTILEILELKCQQLFGFIPDDMELSFKPLRIMSSEQEENVKTLKFNRVLSSRSAGEITSKEFREACNHDDLLPVALDPDLDILSERVEEADAMGASADKDGDGIADDAEDADKAKAISDNEKGDKNLAKDAKPAKDPKDQKKSSE